MEGKGGGWKNGRPGRDRREKESGGNGNGEKVLKKERSGKDTFKIGGRGGGGRGRR